MRINIDFDSNDPVDTPKTKRFYRALASSLLHIIGDLDEEAETVPTGTSDPDTAVGRAAAIAALRPEERVAPPLHSFGFAEAGQAPPPPPPPLKSLAELQVEANAGKPWLVPPPPPPSGNVVVGNFPPPPPPPPPPSSASLTIVPTVAASPVAPPVLTAGAALTVASAEYDSAGMPWDARIHQKGKSVTKQGVWKLQKGIHEKQPGLVEAVVKELASRSVGSNTSFAPSVVPPPPPPVSLPPGSMLVPPPPPSATVGMVPPPPPPPPVPAQGGAANAGASDGAAAPSEFKVLIDRILGLKIAPTDVQRLCLFHGAPSLMELNKMQSLFPAVRQSLDKIDAGIPLEMILNRQA